MIKNKNIDPDAAIAVTKISGGVSTTNTATLTNKTLTAPTITSPTITGTATIGNGMTITTPVLSGAVTGTYELAGTPTITAPTITAPVITGAMTVADGATLTTPVITLDVQVLAAAGSNQGDAGAMTLTAPGLCHATGADATKGVVLPAAAAGKMIIVKNSDAANAVLKVYPATGDAINAIAANTEISMAAKTCAVFTAIDATTWFTAPLLPS